MPSPLPHWWGTSERLTYLQNFPWHGTESQFTFFFYTVWLLPPPFPSCRLTLRIPLINNLIAIICLKPCAGFLGTDLQKRSVCYVSHTQGYLLQALGNCFYLPAKISQLFLLFSPLIPSSLCSNANNEGPFWWLCVKHQVSHSPLPAWCPPCGMVYYRLCPVRCSLVHLFALASERQGSPLICSLLFPWQRDGWYQVRLVLVWLSLKLARISRWSVWEFLLVDLQLALEVPLILCDFFFTIPFISSIHIG